MDRLLCWVSTLTLGIVIDWAAHKYANDRIAGGGQTNRLLEGGWRVFDPEGFEVVRFDE